ncbi:hypothetical protein PCC9214_01898 [Planktothrix tepida]|uniref:Uncharacterized protein n=2 Tax=Planktothrix TaxID=54304 RepID=A0A1J1LKY6_9CYAN|nr:MULTISPECIES: hypothetical protein [Planktothrix]CAD5940605.1 hypothetical protein PCC9214_01898 [Planktothrix tepida]CAD5970871.1 hypothetical protein NO713_03812 [Planktothrix pseudagardhii]CUR33143.1 hypothetical protein PL9214500390 [Planktothrix tepida PCC 9214]
MASKIVSLVFNFCGVAVVVGVSSLNPAYSLNISSTSETTANSNSNAEQINSSFQRKQYGKHLDCFTWHDKSAIDGGQQDIDGYCNLEGVTPKLEFNEPAPDVSSDQQIEKSVIDQENIDQENIDQENQDASSLPSTTTSTSGSKKQGSKEKIVNSEKTIQLPGFQDALQYQALNSSLDEEPSFSIPITWVMGIVITLSLGLTVFFEQK